MSITLLYHASFTRNQFEAALAKEPYNEWMKGGRPFLVSSLAGVSIDFLSQYFIETMGKVSVPFVAVAFDVNNPYIACLPQILGVIGCVGVFISLVCEDDKAYARERQVIQILNSYKPEDFIRLRDVNLLMKYAPPTIWQYMGKNKFSYG